MKKIILVFIFVVTLCAAALAQSNFTDNTFVITTYYPAPYGVYRNMRLQPSDLPSAGVGPGVMYYNQTENMMKFYNNDTWVNMTGGGGGGGGFWAQNGTFIYNTNNDTVLIGSSSLLPAIGHGNRLAVIGAGTRLGTGNAYTNLFVGSDPTYYKGVGLGWDTSGYIGVIAAGSMGSGSQLAFWTANPSGIWGERLRLSADGNFGIGTPVPAQALDVNGKIIMRSETTAADSNNTVVTKGYLSTFGSTEPGTWRGYGEKILTPSGVHSCSAFKEPFICSGITALCQNGYTLLCPSSYSDGTNQHDACTCMKN